MRLLKICRNMMELSFFVFLLLTLALDIPILFFHCKLITIETGSMVPALPVGSVCLIQETDPFYIKEGDIITYQLQDEDHTLVTHRVCSVGTGTGDESTKVQYFLTQGDANKELDAGRIPVDAVLGKVRFCWPWMGQVVVFLTSISGKIGSICFLLLTMIAIHVIDQYLDIRRRLLFPKRKKENYF